MPSASSGVIGRTCATVPSRRTTSASHSTGAPVACAETRSIAPVSSLSSPPSMGSSCHVGPHDPRRWRVLVAWSSPRSSAPDAWSAATTPTGRSPGRSSSAASPTRSAPPAPGSARAGTSSSSPRRPSATPSGRPRRSPARPSDPWLGRHTGGAGARAVPVAQGRLPRPLRRARQGLDRPRRGALAGALLGRRHRHGVAAHPAHRHRRGPRQPLLRRAAGAPRRRPRGLRHPVQPHASSGVVSIGYAVPGPRSPSLRRHRRTGREVAHWGRFGVAGEEA